MSGDVSSQSNVHWYGNPEREKERVRESSVLSSDRLREEVVEELERHELRLERITETGASTLGFRDCEGGRIGRTCYSDLVTVLHTLKLYSK